MIWRKIRTAIYTPDEESHGLQIHNDNHAKTNVYLVYISFSGDYVLRGLVVQKTFQTKKCYYLCRSTRLYY